MTTVDENKETLKKMHKIIFEILCDIDDFCTEHNITYFLSGGTCLGAVRHQGFIPWDDDGDLMMPRPDYERFLALFPQEFEQKYGTGALSTNPDWQRQYARIWDKKTLWKSKNIADITMGVFVDLFPIDGLPENRLVRKLFYSRIKLLSVIGNACVKKEFLEGERYHTIKKLTKVLLGTLGKRYFSTRMENMAKKYDFATSRYVGVSMAAHYGERETIDREAMQTEVRLPFEGRRLPVPAGYRQYLTNLYGDYSKIPEGAEENDLSNLGHWEVIIPD